MVMELVMWQPEDRRLFEGVLASADGAELPDQIPRLILAGPLRRRLVAECRVEKIRQQLRNCYLKNSSSSRYILIKSAVVDLDINSYIS